MAMMGSKSDRILNKMLLRDDAGGLGQLKHFALPLCWSMHQYFVIALTSPSISCPHAPQAADCSVGVEVPKYSSPCGGLLPRTDLSSPSFAYHKVHTQGSLKFSSSTSTDVNFFSILRFDTLQSNHGPSSPFIAAHDTPLLIAIALRPGH